MTVEKDPVRIATWNIGHFSFGDLPHTTVSDAEFLSKAAEYEDYIYRVLDADVLSLNEYSKMFTPSHPARDTVFGGYATAFEGNEYHYSCNALYSRVDLTNIGAHEFECNKTADMESPHGIYASDYYYVTADLCLNKETVKLVSVHLAFYAGSAAVPPPIPEDQMKELIGAFRDCDRVILMGDWNCTPDRLSPFEEAGYTLLNTDRTLSTFAKSPASLDNFVYKGVTVSDFTLSETKLSDHYAISCTVTIPEGKA